MVHILSAKFPDLQIFTLADFPNAPEPEETGTTYAQNAAIKSESAAAFTNEWSLADDAGLEVYALNGEPGLYSKRFAGEETPFPEKMAKILDLLKDVPEEKRTARFRCCIALTQPRSSPAGGGSALRAMGAQTADSETVIFEATCEGRIARTPSGAGGFGYDPIFYLPELDCTMADLTAEQKHAISHRGKVLAMLATYLSQT